ncbi:MAG: endonuclease domain-containing protein [Ardenticatenales bacterium]
MMRIRGTLAEVESAAREMRRAMTPAEQVLWEALRDGRLDGYRFRRQHSVGRFILDFYCSQRRLVVEVDGGYHDEPEQIARDNARTEHLRRHRYSVLRVSNDAVLHHLDDVLDAIDAHLNTPPPALGEGSDALRASGGEGLLGHFSPSVLPTSEPRP